MALDPIHIGAGGYRLVRVDNAIVREPGTNIPKIPGTTIEGCARTYSYYKKKEKNLNTSSMNEACAVGKKMKIKGKEQQPCGKCDVCITYGFTTDEKSLHGMAQFSDARILFFPVHSTIGPVWITCPSILKEFGIDENISNDEIKTSINKEKLNLGWIYLKKEGDFNASRLYDNLKKGGELEEIPNEFKQIEQRIVLVSDKLFSQIVNSNLEVRTSVAIDPTTGAAEEGALYTYEAIPRATMFWFNLV
ncbi:MAG: type III-B CRISPR module RAMP protein Cmr4, partial [Candidatus Altarchaeaceae archaeon]